MVHSTFWIEARLWGTEHAPGFHIDNILLHALAAVLLWRALAAIDIPAPWFAAAIFAVHPVMVESVTWVTERKNVLSIVFYLLAFHAYRRSGLLDPIEAPDVHPGLRRNRWYFASLFFFLLALLSKTVTCSLPAAILLIIWWKRGKLSWADVKPLLPMFVIGACLSAFTGHLEHTHVGARGPDFDWSILDRCLIAGHAICFYALKLVWPHPLMFMYPRWDLHDPSGLQFLYPILVIADVIGLWIARRWIGRGPLVAVLFFIGTLTPALGFVNVYPMRYSFVADHFQYLASIGLIALIAAGFCRIPRSIPWKWLMAVILAPLILLTWRQQRIYKDPVTLWTHTIEQNETCWMAHINLASAFSAQNKSGQPSDKAMAQSMRALELAPNEADTQWDMGVAMAQRSRWTEAAERFRKATECDSECAPAWASLARLLWDHFDTPLAQAQAVEAAKRAIAIQPNQDDPHFVLGCFAELRGDWPGAISQFNQALTINAKDYSAHSHLGDCLLQTGHAGEAAGEYTRVLEHDPKDLPAMTNLGNANLMAGRIPDAIDCYQKALAIDPKWAPAREALAKIK
jgi:tetratricopeptide (TPR) repeat protein